MTPTTRPASVPATHVRSRRVDAVPALALSGIRKSFGSFLALDDVDFAAARGEVHALLGENGAGKSSLMNVAAGLYAADAGAMAIDGNPVVLSGPNHARTLRIGMVHQHYKLVKSFTVAENILMANPRGSFARGMKAILAEIRRAADALEFEIDPERRLDTLSIAEQQRVEILKVLVAGAEIIILDEPTAVLTDTEGERLLTTVRGLASRGAAVILVTHKLAEVKEFTDRVTVMRAGRTIASIEPDGVSATELAELVVGSSVAEPTRLQRSAGRDRLYVAGLRCARDDGHVAVQDTSFTVRAGEIYGVAGVSGNGQTELAEAIMGVRPVLAGAIEFADAGNIATEGPRARRAHGLAAIPADRHAYGLAAGLSVAENFGIGHVEARHYGSWAWLDSRAMRAEAAAALREFEVQGVRGLGQKAALLSGGNAQKLVLARELSRNPSIIVAHCPSRGLDVRACAAVHERLLQARDAGAAVLLISDDLDEILNLSDRIGVMVRGRIAREFTAPAERQAVGSVMVHHA